MFYREASDQYIREGEPFTIEGTQYPANWLNTSTPEEKEALGLKEAIIVGERKDDRYYWVSETLENGKLVYTSIPKDLEMVRAWAHSSLNQQAYSLLFTSDWMIIRKAETNIEVPAEWSMYRDNIRLEVNIGRGKIDAAISVDDLAAIRHNWPTSPDAPVAEAPAEEPAS